MRRYMSSDFGGHTVGSLIRNVLKLHNRLRVEVMGIGMMKVSALPRPARRRARSAPARRGAERGGGGGARQGDGTEWNLEMERSADKWLSIHGEPTRGESIHLMTNTRTSAPEAGPVFFLSLSPLARTAVKRKAAPRAAGMTDHAAAFAVDALEVA